MGVFCKVERPPICRARAAGLLAPGRRPTTRHPRRGAAGLSPGTIGVAHAAWSRPPAGRHVAAQLDGSRLTRATSHPTGARSPSESGCRKSRFTGCGTLMPASSSPAVWTSSPSASASARRSRALRLRFTPICLQATTARRRPRSTRPCRADNFSVLRCQLRAKRSRLFLKTWC
jgi:hypothetical protein